MEHHTRSIAKSLTWRLFSFFLTVVIIFAYTRNIKQSLGVGFGIDLVKMVLYYMHERLWNRIRFGRQRVPDYQI
jgi:uncharacterized membrane protein